MSHPVGPYPIPAGRTARRLVWEFLPPHLRSAIEAQCGSPVVETFSQTSGFTPGFASVLVCADGSRHFVKAASVKAQQLFADWGYRPVNETVLEANKDKFPDPPGLFTIEDLGGWEAVNTKFFEDKTGIVSQVQQATGKSQ